MSTGIQERVISLESLAVAGPSHLSTMDAVSEVQVYRIGCTASVASTKTYPAEEIIFYYEMISDKY